MTTAEKQSDRELVRVTLIDDGSENGDVEIVITPWSRKVASKRQQLKLAREIGGHVQRALGTRWVDDLRRLNVTELTFLRVSLDQDGHTAVEFSAIDADSHRTATELAQTVVETIMRTFGVDALREFRWLNTPHPTVH